MVTKISPLFSIVIPTRNRAHLLPNAINSALNQAFDDYEVVIVANDCQDNTRDVVHSMSNSRVRYFETDKMLTMPENWEFAWTKATGKYITYLCDDDALVPNALQFLAENALQDNPSIVSWEDAIYYYPNWNDEKIQNVLLLFFFGDTYIEDINTELIRKKLVRFDFKWSEPIPKLLNCIARRDYFEEWRNRLGQLFFPIAPDYSFACIVANVCSSIRIVHKPLSVRGISDYSIGSNAGLGTAGQNFYKEFGGFDFYKETENNLPLSINHLAATYIRTNAALLRNNIAAEPLDHKAFNLALANQLIECRKLLPNWDQYVEEHLNKSRSFSPDLYEQIKTILSQPPLPEQTESLRDLHARTKKMGLEYEGNYNNALTQHVNDEECALCMMSLKNELLVDQHWSYLYLFGEMLDANNIYSISLHVHRYYDLLLKCKKQQEIAKNKMSKSHYAL